MSVGLRMRKLAMYSTLPRAFFGASSRSVINPLWRSCGFNSPKARPVSSSYGWPVMAVVVSMMILVTRASLGGAQARGSRVVLSSARPSTEVCSERKDAGTEVSAGHETGQSQSVSECGVGIGVRVVRCLSRTGKGMRERRCAIARFFHVLSSRCRGQKSGEKDNRIWQALIL